MEKVHGNEGDLGWGGEPVTEFTVTRREKGEDAEWLQHLPGRVTYVCLDREQEQLLQDSGKRSVGFHLHFALWHENEVTEE